MVSFLDFLLTIQLQMEMKGETYINGNRMDTGGHTIDSPAQIIEFKLEDKITFGAQKSGVTIQFRMSFTRVFLFFFFFVLYLIL